MSIKYTKLQYLDCQAYISFYMTSPQRITQLQCQEMNLYFKQYFTTRIFQSLQYFPSLLSKYYPQIQLLINFLLFRLSTGINHPQPGDMLQNIHFPKLSFRLRLLWFLLTVLLPYLKSRFLHHHPLLERLQSIYNTCSYLNTASFILNGHYRTLLQRILRIKMEFIRQGEKRVLNHSLMNRMMVWKIYEMALKTIVPNVYAVVGSAFKSVFYMSAYMQVGEEGTCGYCGDAVSMAVRSMPCKHLACFYCKEEGNQRGCPKCGKNIDQWEELYL